MTRAQHGCARRTQEGLCNFTEVSAALTGLGAFHVPKNRSKEMTLQKLSEWPQVRSGMAARIAGLYSQLCHGFAFTQHQALHKIAPCHSTPKLWISHWCLTSHHLSLLLANKALWILMAFCWLLVPTGWELSRTCEQMKAWFITLNTRTSYWTCGISAFQRKHTKHLIGAWRIHHWKCCFRLTLGPESNYTL